MSNSNQNIDTPTLSYVTSGFQSTSVDPSVANKPVILNNVYITLSPIDPNYPSNDPNTKIHHNALDQLLPISVIGKSGHALINELFQNNLANKIIDVYYRIKKNVEYISVGKESLYPITPQYETYGTDFLNCRNSRHLFYLIHHQNISFGHLVQFTAHFIEVKKMLNHRKDYRVSF